MAESSSGLREILAIFGIGVDTSELKEGENRLEGFLGKVTAVASGLAAALAVKEVYAFAEGQAALADKIDDTAVAMGISTDEVQAWQFAARAMGDDADELLRSMSKLQAQAATSGKDFAGFGIEVKQADGTIKEADKLLIDTAKALGKIEDPAKRAAAAKKLFGKAYRSILPTLSEGEEGIGKLIELYHKLGGGVSKEAIKAAGDFQKKQAGLSLATGTLSGEIAGKLYPILGKISEVVSGLIVKFVDVARRTNVVKVAFAVLGGIASFFAIKMLIAAAPVLLLAAAFALLIIAVEDIVGLFEGKKSVIGGFIDMLLGKGASVQFVKDLGVAWEGIKEAVKGTVPFAKELFTELKIIAQIIIGLLKLLGKAGGAVGDLMAKVSNEQQEESTEVARIGWLNTVKRRLGTTFGGKGLTEGNAMPAPMLPAGQGVMAGPTEIGNFEINIDAPGGNPAAVKGAVVDGVNQAMEDRRRAKARLQRSGSP
jgi:hypothetical protein